MGIVPGKEREQNTKESAEGDGDNPQNNAINEMQILEGHKDIVRLLIKIDEFRLASASDDGQIIVWSQATGQRLFTLTGHTRPVTCLLLLDRHTLISGSSDKSIRFWNITTGSCEHVINPAHTGSVQCLAKLDQDHVPLLFCSGGNDKQLCLWKSSTPSAKPSLLGTIERKEEENLHCLLPISGQRLVTASNASYLYTLAFDKLLAYHRESVRCLINVSDTLFASGSLDGSIVVWQSETLAPLKILEYPERFFDNHTYPFAVNHMLVLGDKYICAAIGRGFRVYDVESGECVLECKDAHDAALTYLIPLYKGTRLVSCSADSSIKMWATTSTALARGNRGGRGGGKKAATQVGEMWGHSDAITTMLPFSQDSFVSCAADGLVVLWKDGRSQSELRNRFATASLLHHHLSLSQEPSFEEEEPDDWNDATDPDGKLVDNDNGEKKETLEEPLSPWLADVHESLEVTASGDSLTPEMSSRSQRFTPLGKGL